MPRKRKPPRVYFRKPRPGRGGSWVILDGGREYPTGAASQQDANKALGQYLIGQSAAPSSPQQRESITVGDCLTIYAQEHGPSVADPARMGWAIEALLPFWGELQVSSVTGAACRRYVRERARSASTVRRELGVMRAALKHCEREGYLVSAPAVVLPAKPPAKARWLTRDEVAALIWATRRDSRTKHIARAILIGVYTGTRPGAIRALQWEPNTTGGHVDLDRGVMYREAAAAMRTKKRQTPLRIPRQLLAHLRRWKGEGHIVQYAGRPVAEIKSRTWQSLCKRAGIEHCTPHSLRHTAATWLMQRGASKWDAAGYLGMTVDTLEAVYGHHHPDHQGTALIAMEGR